jgi:protein ImuB
VVIEAETCHGESMRRLWRHEGVLHAAALADRTRWQLEGWLAGTAVERPTGGLSRLTLVPDDVVPARGRQLGFWGGESHAAERAARTAARVAAMSAPGAVTVPERQGGRRPDDQFELVPVTAVDLTERGPLTASEAPWPGRLPVAPALVRGDRSLPVEVLDADDAPVTVTGRGMASAPPAQVDGVEVVAWAGPWPLLERWWDPAAARRQARFQVVTSDGQAHLLVVEGGRWWSTGHYD